MLLALGIVSPILHYTLFSRYW